MGNLYTNDLDSLSFEDIEDLIENSTPKKKTSVVTSPSMPMDKSVPALHFKILKKYGRIGNDQFAPLLTKVDWRGYERYDIRRWKADGTPGKGVTFTYAELKVLYNALCSFNFRGTYRIKLREYRGAQRKAIFYYKIALLSTSEERGVVWNKEVNVIDWGYGPKVDFHRWTENYTKCGKGICLSFDELKALKVLLENIF